MGISNLITILGPTASGKTSLAAHFAAAVGGEVISADSRQVYRGMDIGTGKDLADYTVNGHQVPFHLIDIVDPGYEYNVYEFQQDFVKSFQQITSKNKPAVLCGGSGMYIDAVIRNYELREVPENQKLREALSKYSMDDLEQRLKEYGPIHNTTDVSDYQRLIRAIEIAEFKRTHPFIPPMPDIHSINFGVRFERSETRNRITQRLKARLDEGMVDEVRGLLRGGLSPEQLTFYGLEYKYLTLYVCGAMSFDDMFTRLNTAIHQFAKRQMTWFRRMEKKGVHIHWIDGNLSMDEKLDAVIGLLPK